MADDRTIAVAAAGIDSVDRTRLPLPESKFNGIVGKSYLESKGFGQVSTFGGPVQIPQLDFDRSDEIFAALATLT
jgi:hypothetical protein